MSDACELLHRTSINGFNSVSSVPSVVKKDVVKRPSGAIA